MGNSESSNPIRNMDKRTARREYREDFVGGINNYKEKIKGSPKGDSSKPTNQWNNGDLKVYVRKRPIFQHEIAAGEFDVATCVGTNQIIIHDARMHSDMMRQMLHHHQFEFDRVFPDNVDNKFVYDNTAKPLVEIACNGGFATALVYGQTGSGKTFTMVSIYSQAAQEIFSHLDHEVERFQKPPTVSVSFTEVAGDAVHDLLNGFQGATLRTAADGSVHAFPVIEPVVSSAEELMGMIQHGLNIRSTAATGVHDSSSRSHAILRIYIQRYDLAQDSAYTEGTLTLVDLAGSEHRIDSMYHGKERRKETSQINASLMALKECIRARSLGGAGAGQRGHVYRKSKLTLALKNSFSLPQARTIVIATVSPASKDTEHSLNTLRHACLMHGQDTNEESRFITGGETVVEFIGEVNVAGLARKNRAHKKVHGEIENIKTSNGNMIENKVARQANQEVELTDKMKRKLRRMAETKSFNSLDPIVRDILTEHRGRLGNEKYQLLRLQRNISAHNSVNDMEAMEEDVADEIEKYHSSLKSKVQDDEEREIVEQLVVDPSSYEKLYEDDFEPSASIPQVKKEAHKASVPLLDTAKTKPNLGNIISIGQLYECIYVVKDTVHENLLKVQLDAVCKLHGYSSLEIQNYLLNRNSLNKSNNSSQYRTAPGAAVITVNEEDNTYPVPNTTRSSTSHTSLTARSKSPYRRHASTKPQLTSEPSTASIASTNGRVTPRSATPTSRHVRSSTPTNSRIQSSSINSHPNTITTTATAANRQQNEKEQQYLQAKQKLEEEAKVRKARQDAAKAVKEQSLRRKSLPAQDNREQALASAIAESTRSLENDQHSNYEGELDRLVSVMEADDKAGKDQKMSSAMKYGLKKQIALLRAAILKRERAKQKEKEGIRSINIGSENEIEALEGAERLREYTLHEEYLVSDLGRPIVRRTSSRHAAQRYEGESSLADMRPPSARTSTESLMQKKVINYEDDYYGYGQPYVQSRNSRFE